MRNNDIIKIAIEGDLTALEAILKKEPLPRNIIHKVIFSGWHQAEDMRIIEMLIKHGADVNQLADNSRPLHEAARVGPFPKRSAEATKLLLGKGADPNLCDSLGRTPLHIAVQSIAFETTTLLLQAGAHINAKDRNGKTPLQYCLYWYHENFSETEDPDEKANERYSADSYVLNQLQAMLSYKPASDGEGKDAPINIALSRKMSEDIVNTLLEMHAPIQGRVLEGDQSYHPLLLVAHNGYSNDILKKFSVIDPRLPAFDEGPSCIEFLTQKYPDAARFLCKQDKSLILDKNLLHSAAAGNSLDLVKWLVENGAPLNKRSPKGNTPVDLAKKYGKEEIVEFLEKVSRG